MANTSLHLLQNSFPMPFLKQYSMHYVTSSLDKLKRVASVLDHLTDALGADDSL